ncbi:hypothetical protein [Kitasatospora sp. NPDC057198]|uniref:hypothetical protein n=1 Tax=Kitasatospora sp. NPDC057198 TaxID=3346046 RepID=UPI0036435EE7
MVGDQARVDHLVRAHRIDAVHIHQEAPRPARAQVHHPSFELLTEKAHFVDRAEEQQSTSAANSP